MAYNIKVTKVSESKLQNLDFDNIPFGRVFSDHMFIADYIDGKWTNIEIKPYQDMQISPANSALHYGQSIFEGMKATKTVDGNPVFLRPELHAERFANSAKRMCMQPVPTDLFLQAIHTLVDLDKAWIPPREGSALYLRPLLFAMDSFLGVRPSDSYRFMLITGPVGPYYAKPVRLLAQEEYIRAAVGGVGEAKTAGNYAASLLPATKAIDAGYDQVLWLDGIEKKYVQEVGTMNIFFNINGTLITPETDGAILKGITRKCVLELLDDTDISVEVRQIDINEIIEHHKNGNLLEVFGVGTAAVVSEVSHLSYRDSHLDIPNVGKDNNVAKMIKSMIEDLRTGKTEDKNGWLVPVDSKTELV